MGCNAGHGRKATCNGLSSSIQEVAYEVTEGQNARLNAPCHCALHAPRHIEEKCIDMTVLDKVLFSLQRP